MTLTQITNTLNRIPTGTYTRISYDIFPPMTKAAKDDGWVVQKFVSITGRFANYGHLKSVIARRGSAEDAAKPNMWYHEIIPNKLVKHNNKDEYYLSFVKDNKSSKPIIMYVISNKNTGEYTLITSEQEVRDRKIVQEGYWRDYAANEMKIINIENVSEIRQKQRN